MVELDVSPKIWPQFHVELLYKASEGPLPLQAQDDTRTFPILVKGKDGICQLESLNVF